MTKLESEWLGHFMQLRKDMVWQAYGASTVRAIMRLVAMSETHPRFAMLFSDKIEWILARKSETEQLLAQNDSGIEKAQNRMKQLEADPEVKKFADMVRGAFLDA